MQVQGVRVLRRQQQTTPRLLTGETVGCEVPFSHDGLERRIHGEACSFVVPGGGGRTAHTLHEAARFLR